jgi:NAD(P)-dependent dehydrogenase (short-subunit alcohol dehydrogenase family)
VAEADGPVTGLLEGRLALVTGGASGIGAATARRFAEEGAAVAVLDVDVDGAQAVAAEVGGHAVAADVADAAAMADGVAAAVDALGGLTTVVNNAGTGNVLALHDYADTEWDRLLDVNLRGVFHGLRATLPRLRDGGGGEVVNVASVSGLRPTRGEAPYSAAKAGVVSLTRSAALEYAPEVRVNAVAPGFIDTPLTSFAVEDEARAGPIVAGTPLRRIGTAEEVADVIVFLCSPLARYVTGEVVVVDGGSVLTNPQVDAFLGGLLEG